MADEAEELKKVVAKDFRDSLRSATDQVDHCIAVAEEYGIEGFKDLTLIRAELQGMVYRIEEEVIEHGR